MNRSKILLCIASVVVLYIIIYFTNVFKVSRIRDNSMLPAYNTGDWVMLSRFGNVSYQSVCQISSNVLSKARVKNSPFFRVVGMGGDTIEINDGYLLRNGFMADNPEKLTFNYYVINRTKEKRIPIADQLKIPPRIIGDSIIFCLNYKEYKEFSNQYYFYKANKQKHGRDEEEIYGSTIESGWNASNYGPIVIPMGECFLLVDNRDNFKDSRHFGPVKLHDIIAVVLNNP